MMLKYGGFGKRILLMQESNSCRLYSLWWKDLLKLGDSMKENARWIDSVALRCRFKELYELSDCKFKFVNEMEVWEDYGWKWMSGFQEERLVRELEYQLIEMHQLLLEVSPRQRVQDLFLWSCPLFNLFTVMSQDDFIQRAKRLDSLDISLKTTLDFVWQSLVPMKVKVFAWRLFLDRLPTHSNLAAKGVISNPHEVVCVFRFKIVKCLDHVFILCPKIRLVWKAIVEWFSVPWAVFENCGDHFLGWYLRFIRNTSKKTTSIIWLCT
ncbi:unnamed protein product [Lathyrus sativus]|nr:unnamed protein product [Lathyrus sativus]